MREAYNAASAVSLGSTVRVLNYLLLLGGGGRNGEEGAVVLISAREGNGDSFPPVFSFLAWRGVVAF